MFSPSVLCARRHCFLNNFLEVKLSMLSFCFSLIALNSQIRVADRPMTKQGLTGMKTSAGRGTCIRLLSLKCETDLSTISRGFIKGWAAGQIEGRRISMVGSRLSAPAQFKIIAEI